MGICGKEFDDCPKVRCCKNIYEWNIVVATLHFLQALSQIILLNALFWSKGNDVPNLDLSIPVTVWKKTSELNRTFTAPTESCDVVQPRIFPSSDGDFWKLYDEQIKYSGISVQWIIISFFLLSSVFQWAAACGKIQKDNNGETFYDYESLVGKDRNPLRFIEYAFSASIMIAVISVQSGIQNYYTVLLICVTCSITQILGLISEYTRAKLLDIVKDDDDTWAPWCMNRNIESKRRDEYENNLFLAYMSQFSAWLSFGSAYGVIINHFYASNQNCSGGTAPDFVYAIVWSQAGLFTSFGLIQVLSLVFSKKCRSRIYCGNQEAVYIFLSLAAKSVLCWLLFSYVFVELANN